MNNMFDNIGFADRMDSTSLPLCSPRAAFSSECNRTITMSGSVFLKRVYITNVPTYSSKFGYFLTLILFSLLCRIRYKNNSHGARGERSGSEVESMRRKSVQGLFNESLTYG